MVGMETTATEKNAQKACKPGKKNNWGSIYLIVKTKSTSLPTKKKKVLKNG